MEFLFGDSDDSANVEMYEKRQKFSKAFDHAQPKLGDFGTCGWSQYVWPDRKFFKSCQAVHEFADEFVAKALQTSPGEKKPLGRHERYVFLNELTTATRDPKRIRDELLNILLAGRDTTASLLTTAFHALARHSSVWKKLKQEVNGLGSDVPNYETLKEMKYLKYFLNECKLYRSFTHVASTLLTTNRSPALSRSPNQLSHCQQGYNSSAWRRTRR